jgi:hypothetical protein
MKEAAAAAESYCIMSELSFWQKSQKSSASTSMLACLLACSLNQSLQ